MAESAEPEKDVAVLAKVAFQRYDIDGDGSISPDELGILLKAIGGEDEHVQRIITDFDKSGDGKLQFDEFVDWLMTDTVHGSAVLQDVIDVDDLELLQDIGLLTLSRAHSDEHCPPEMAEDEMAETGSGEVPVLARSKSAEEREAVRQPICELLKEVQFLDHGHPLFMHGRGFQGEPKAPRASWVSHEPPRDDHACPPWLTATEYMDLPDVCTSKVKQLAALMQISKKTVLYTGAGISASAVGQAARSGSITVGFKANPLSARPTATHYALGFLGQQGLIHGWVQQNHDGLPQKAGFPQHCINEIHGSWFDPSNPVVKYSGSLHGKAYPWMCEDAATADLVIVLGTSLGGLNADQVALDAAERSLTGAALGTACINLQQTSEDGKMTVRFFGKSDDILKALLRELGFGSFRPAPMRWPRESKVLVPYDRDGRRLAAGEKQWMWLDLTDRARVRITPGHNIQGAKQPKYMHIGATRPVVFKGVTRNPGIGNGTVVRREQDHFVLNVEGEGMNLGVWWLVAAMSGAADVLPVVNQRPVFEPKT